MNATFVWLASRSPRRIELLAQIGVTVRPLVAGTDGDVDEDDEALEATRPGEAPADYVARVAQAKLAAALERHRRRGLEPAPVLAADTTARCAAELEIPVSILTAVIGAPLFILLLRRTGLVR